MVRTRIALAAGRLVQALSELDLLATVPPGDPPLFAAATAVRIAVCAELNLPARAQQTADAAIAELAKLGSAPEAVALLERARQDAAAREASTMALWELPFTTRRDRESASAAPVVQDEPEDTRSRFSSAWTAAVNRVFGALERGDLDAASAAQARLEALVAGAESRLISCRVGLSAALVDYYRAGPVPAERFLALAEELHAIGARLLEIQAVRFAAWACARQRRLDDYAQLAHRASEIVDEVASELDPRIARCSL